MTTNYSMKTQILLLRIAGAISLLFMIFHFMFYCMFKWESTLSCLSNNNHSILLTYHVISILVLGFMALIPIMQAGVLLASPLKYTILSLFSLFFLIRIVTEFTLFGISGVQSLIIIIMCAIPMIFFTIPLLMKS